MRPGIDDDNEKNHQVDRTIVKCVLDIAPQVWRKSEIENKFECFKIATECI